MKKLILLSAIILLNISCKKEIKKVPKVKYSFESKTTTINWTAFKTTKKVPVKGVFKNINVTNLKVAETPIEALNGLEFSIPVNSIDTKDKSRDAKIIKNFFGAMTDSQNLTGKLTIGDKGSGSITLKMNGISKELPMTYVISGQLAEVSASINLDNWQAKAAIKALNLACKDLHKANDGISKTWNEVKINIISYLKVE
jgi:polyisoprenoid-binding protein YceI